VEDSNRPELRWLGNQPMPAGAACIVPALMPQVCAHDTGAVARQLAVQVGGSACACVAFANLANGSL